MPQFYDQMIANRIVPDAFTYSSLLIGGDRFPRSARRGA